MGNAEKLAFVVLLNCFRDEMEHFYYIISFYATEDQFFLKTHPGLSIYCWYMVAFNKHSFLVAESPFLVMKPHGLYVLREMKISLNLRRF